MRGFLRSTDGKIMFSQALSQLPSHTQKILHDSEGDKVRLRVEYSTISGDNIIPGPGITAEAGEDNNYNYGHLLPHPKQQTMMTGDKTKAGKILQPFRRGRKDLLHKGGYDEGDREESTLMTKQGPVRGGKSHPSGVRSSGYTSHSACATRHMCEPRRTSAARYGSPEKGGGGGKGEEGVT